VGVFQSFSKDFDARTVRIPLQAAQQLMLTNGANLLVVSLHHTDDTDAAYDALRTRLAPGLDIRSWRELSDFFDKTVQLYDRQFGILQLIILAMVLLSVVNSVNMSVFERQAEFGTMLALGNRPPDIFRLLLVENAILGLIGATLGVLIGMAVALGVSAIGIPMPPPPNANLGYVAFIRIVPTTIASAFLIGLVATVLAAIFPARRVASTQIVDALRQGVGARPASQGVIMSLFDRFNLGAGFSKYFKIEAAATDAIRDEVYRVRHEVYCEELKFEPERPDRREIDAYDAHS